MQLSGTVCLSVCPTWPPHAAAAGLLLWAGGQEISIDCCTAGGPTVSISRAAARRAAANAGSATLSAEVLFCSVLFVLDPRVGHTMDILSPFISVLCHSERMFHVESCPCLDVVHPDRSWSSLQRK